VILSYLMGTMPCFASAEWPTQGWGHGPLAEVRRTRFGPGPSPSCPSTWWTVTGFEPVTSSVSGNAIYGSCFRIFKVSCSVRSVLVRWCPSLSAAVVTQLVTHLQPCGPLGQLAFMTFLDRTSNVLTHR
jgi:hypothetical protein